MKRSTAIYKAVQNLNLKDTYPTLRYCQKCYGKGKWIFFKETGTCTDCWGHGMIGGVEAVYKQINEYIDSGSLDIEEILKHSNTVP